MATVGATLDMESCRRINHPVVKIGWELGQGVIVRLFPFVAFVLFVCLATRLECQGTMHPTIELNKHDAQAIAARVLHDLKPSADFVIVEGETLERDFGWVFLYSTRRYLETKDPGELVPGAGPLVVLRKDGSTRFLSTSVPPKVAVEVFEKQWRSGRPF
jgi:hypothetical protein